MALGLTGIPLGDALQPRLPCRLLTIKRLSRHKSLCWAHPSHLSGSPAVKVAQFERHRGPVQCVRVALLRRNLHLLPESVDVVVELHPRWAPRYR